MSTHSLKLVLAICLIITTITILLVLHHNDWNSSSTKQQKIHQRPLIMNSNLFLNDILIRSYPDIVPTPAFVKDSNNYLDDKCASPLFYYNLYDIIQCHITTMQSNNISNYTYQGTMNLTEYYLKRNTINDHVLSIYQQYITEDGLVI